MRMALLDDAERLLIEAQSINPLNTDHTANLARLTTRRVASNPGAADRQGLLNQAETYYQEALGLSPQNSIIRNEYARLALDLKRSCEEAIAIFEESIRIDPFYLNSYYGLTDTLVTCASAQSDLAAQQELFAAAIDSLSAGIALKPDDPRAWIQLGQLHDQVGNPQEAIVAYQEAREVDETGLIAPWRIQILEAGSYQVLGDLAMARALAEQALQTAPADAAAQIETFLRGLPE